MSNFESWIMECEQKHMRIWPLCISAKPETGLWKTNYDMFGIESIPEYHLWFNGDSHQIVTDIQEAFRIWEYNK